jgi:hypothetical protein
MDTTPSVRARSPFWLSLALCLVAALTLAACGGGGGSDGDAPLIDGADRIDSGDVDNDDLEELDFEVADARLGVWKSDQSFDEVSRYYTSGVEDDGWTVETTSEVGETDMIAYLTKDDTVAFVNVMAAVTAREQMNLFDESNLDFDEDSVDDDETVIVITHYTCEEENLADCVPS